VTDHDDVAPKPPVPALDEQPAGPPEDTPPQRWSGPPERQAGQHAAPPGFPSEPAPWQQPPRGMGYGEEARISGAPRTGQPPQPWQQPAPPHEPSTSASGGGQESYGRAAPPFDWNYVDSELVPTRKVPPGRGWRRLVYNATFGLVNLGQSPGELRQAHLEAKIRTLLRGHYKIGVLGKGGVGKTTVAAAVGSVFADLRQDDRVVAIDADTAFGRLGARVDPHVVGSYWDVATDQHLDTFADMRSRVGNNAAGLFVLAGESVTAQRRRVLDPAIYREAVSQLDRHFTISIVDCGTSLDAPVTQEALRDLDALIVVSSPWVDGAAAAGQTLEWLASHELADLLHRSVVVLNDHDGHSDKRTRSILANRFASHGEVVIEVPFDPHLRPGGVIDVANEMNPKTRQRFYELAAAIADHFPSTAQGRRDQRLR
jgi:MinD-like ATPase involved in chromosome partitioning or flagellar assembly